MAKLSQQSDKRNFNFGVLIVLLAFCWLLEGVDYLIFNGWLDSFGIVPRDLRGLIGIPLAPFLHGGFGHLLANSLSFLALGFIVLKAEKKQFYAASAVIVLLGGLGTWLIGRSSVHIGASGLIYGYFGYIMMRGFAEKKMIWILIALLVGLGFGGMIWGVLPTVGESISWEGHLCGMVAGAWLGWKRTLKNR